MKEHRNDGSNFEERLLAQLKAVVAQRGAEEEVSTESAEISSRWRRAARPAALAAGVLAAAAAVLVFSSGGNNPPPAFAKGFAVERQRGGGVAIKIYSANNAAGLEGALAKAGIRSQVTWLAAGMRCREPRFIPSTAKTSAGGTIGALTIDGRGEAMTIGVMSPQQWRDKTRAEVSQSTPNISLDPKAFRPDETVVISGSPVPYGGDPEGGYKAHFGIAEGPIKPCDPVKEANGLLPSRSRGLKTEPGPNRAKAHTSGRTGSNPAAASEPATGAEGNGKGPAKSVGQQGGGGVATVPVSAEDPAGLERALAKAGIRSQVTWLATGMKCREPRFQFSAAKSSGGAKISGLTWMSGPGHATTFGAMSPQQWSERWRDKTPTGQISLDPESLRPDQTVVISGSRVPNEEGKPEADFKVYFAIAEGPIKPCEPVKAPVEATGRSKPSSDPSPSSEAATASQSERRQRVKRISAGTPQPQRSR